MDNGQWHHLKVRWESQTSLQMFLDYGVYVRVSLEYWIGFYVVVVFFVDFKHAPSLGFNLGIYRGTWLNQNLRECESHFNLTIFKFGLVCDRDIEIYLS